MDEARRSTVIPLGATAVMPHPDVVDRLTAERDHHAGIIRNALEREHPDWGTAHRHEPWVQLAADALETIQRLSRQNAEMQRALVARIIVELGHAEKKQRTGGVEDPPRGGGAAGGR